MQNLIIGLREEFYRSAGDEGDGGIKINQLLPRVGLVYELKPEASLYFTYNKGFDPFEASAAKQVFDEPFRPIISQLVEAGAKENFFTNRLYASFSIYQLTVQNVAVNANDISNPDLFVQQSENRSRGVETEVSGTLLPNFGVFGSYAYCVAKITKSKTASQVGMLNDNAPRNTSNTWMKNTHSAREPWKALLLLPGTRR